MDKAENRNHATVVGRCNVLKHHIISRSPNTPNSGNEPLILILHLQWKFIPLTYHLGNPITLNHRLSQIQLRK